MLEPRASFAEPIERRSDSRLSVGHRLALPDIERSVLASNTSKSRHLLPNHPPNVCLDVPLHCATEILPSDSRRELQRLDSVRDSFLQQNAEALAAADGAGKADLQRLQRQFTTLKNTFMHTDVKMGFMEALLEREPRGDETTVCSTLSLLSEILCQGTLLLVLEPLSLGNVGSFKNVRKVSQ